MYYSDARSDERTFQTLQFTLLTVGVALLGVISSQINNLRTLPEPVLAAVPIAIIAIFGVFTMAGSQATVRSYYLRELEAQIGDLTSDSSRVAHLGYTGLLSRLVSLRNNRGHGPYRVLVFIAFGAALALFGGITVQIAAQVGPQLRSLMFVVYSLTLTPLILLSVQATFRGHQLWLSTLAGYSGGGTPLPSGLRRYLLLPRPEDLIKVFMIPGFVIGYTTSTAPLSAPLLTLSWAWIVLEFLAYQARYQWNDIRGLSADLSHPHRTGRMRLPVLASSVRSSLIASSGVMLARVLFAIAMAMGAPSGTTEALLAGIGSIFILGLIYEASRSLEFPALTLALVPMGYPLRFAVGYFIGHGWVDVNWRVLIAGSLLLYLWGSSFVGITWALEGADARLRGLSTSRHISWILRNSLDLSTLVNLQSRALAGKTSPLAAVNCTFALSLAIVPVLASALTGAQWSWSLTLLVLVFFCGGLLIAAASTGERRIGAGLGYLGITLGGSFIYDRHPWFLISSGVATVVIVGVNLSLRGNDYEGLKLALPRALAAARMIPPFIQRLFLGARTSALLKHAPTGRQASDAGGDDKPIL